MKLSIVASITLGGLYLNNAFGAPSGDLQEFFAAIPDLHINMCYTYNGSQQCVEPTIVKLLDGESQNSLDCILEIPMSAPHLKQLMENMPPKDLMARIPRHFSSFYSMTGHLFKNSKYSSAVRIFATMLGSAAITWSILFVADDKTHQSTQTNQSTQNTSDSSDIPCQPSESLSIKVHNKSFSSRDLSPFFSTLQRCRLRAAVATINAVALQNQGQTDFKSDSSEYFAALVPPMASLSPSSDRSGQLAERKSSSSSPESLAPPRAWLQAAHSREAERKKQKGFAVGIAPVSARKNTFEISTAEGREALKKYIAEKRGRSHMGLVLNKEATDSQDAQENDTNITTTYGEVSKFCPETKKKYRRVFVANRGWMSMRAFEEEERKYGSESVVRSRREMAATTNAGNSM
ncbi:hypothetical protein FDK38_003367 [Candidozyma auris]|nr:hypothetical protein FDK38_003367 [[Candida] auris]